MLSAKLMRGATLKVYRGGSHGMCTVNKNEVNEYLLAFIKR
jgi:non-heme chloroperoxidase